MKTYIRFIVDSSTKYFVAWQLCESKLFLRFHVNTQRFCIVDTYRYVNCFYFDAGQLAISQYPEGPATGHLDTGFSWFPWVQERMLRWFPPFQVACTCFSCSPPYFNSVVTNCLLSYYVKWPLLPVDNPTAINKYYYYYYIIKKGTHFCFFQSNNNYAKAPWCYVIRTLPALFINTLSIFILISFVAHVMMTWSVDEQVSAAVAL